MSVWVTASPARSLDQPEGLTPAASPLVESLRTAYVQRVAAYYRDFGAAISTRAPADGDLPVSAFPVVPLPDEDGDVDEIILDGTLLGTLLDVYLCDGWSSIRAIEAYAVAQARPEGAPDQPSGGTVSRPWLVAHGFFVFVRNIVAVLIRDALIDIERRAAVDITARLSVSAAAIATAAAAFDLQPPKARGGAYTIGNSALAAQVTDALTDMVAARVAYDRIVRALADDTTALAATRAREESSNSPQTNQRSAADIAADIAAQTTLADATLAYYQGAQRVLAAQQPIALLVADGLAPGFGQADVEKALAAALGSLYGDIDDLGTAIDPDANTVATLLPGLPPPADPGSSAPSTDGRQISTPIDPHALQQLTVPAGGPELAVIDYARANLSGNHAMFALLHTPSWHLLLIKGAVPTDSFDYVVMHHYLTALAGRLADADRQAAAVAAFFQAFRKISATLAVALMVTPLAEVAPVFAEISSLANTALIAYQVHAVSAQLDQFDTALTGSLIAPDAVGPRGLAAIGELMFARTEFIDGLTESVLRELLIMFVTGRWAALDKVLVPYFFITNVQTMLETEPDPVSDLEE